MHIVINVTHKVDQAFLLRTLEDVIDRIEVRDQNTMKVLQQCMDHISLAGVAVEEDDILQAC